MILPASRRLAAEQGQFGYGVDEVLAVSNFGDSGAGEAACGSGDVAEVVGRLEEGFALVADAAHLFFDLQYGRGHDRRGWVISKEGDGGQ